MLFVGVFFVSNNCEKLKFYAYQNVPCVIIKKIFTTNVYLYINYKKWIRKYIISISYRYAQPISRGLFFQIRNKKIYVN